MVNRTNLGIYISSQNKVKFHNSKISSMFTQTLVDPQTNETTEYLDKEYSVIKKFAPVEN